MLQECDRMGFWRGSKFHPCMVLSGSSPSKWPYSLIFSTGAHSSSSSSPFRDPANNNGKS